MFSIFTLALASLALAQTRTISVVISADNAYQMQIDGKSKDNNGSPMSSSNWQEVKLFRQKVEGNGPWAIKIATQDYGGLRGLFASVYLDGVPVTRTGPNTKFKASNRADSKWDFVSFDDAAWQTGAALNPADCTSAPVLNGWGGVPGYYDNMRRLMNNAHAMNYDPVGLLPSWLGSCYTQNDNNGLLYWSLRVTKNANVQ